MDPQWNNGCHCLMIEREPANILNSYLLRLVIQLDTRITRRFFSLRDRLIKRRVWPFQHYKQSVLPNVDLHESPAHLATSVVEQQLLPE